MMSTCDQVGINGAAIHELIDPNRPNQKFTGELLKYCIDGVSIIHGFDLPHLIKVVRNNLYSKDLKHYISDRWNVSSTDYAISEYDESYIASWDDVEDTYLLDLQGTERLLKKITDEHINPNKSKMKVCVATQVLSETFGKVMLNYSEKSLLPRDCTGTAQVILFFNDLFDSLNGGGPPQDGSLKGSINENSIHFSYWNYAIEMLSNMHYVDKETGKINNRSSVIFKFISTIKCFIEITKLCLNMKMKEISLRYRNLLLKFVLQLFYCMEI